MITTAAVEKILSALVDQRAAITDEINKLDQPHKLYGPVSGTPEHGQWMALRQARDELNVAIITLDKAFPEPEPAQPAQPTSSQLAQSDCDVPIW